MATDRTCVPPTSLKQRRHLDADKTRVCWGSGEGKTVGLTTTVLEGQALECWFPTMYLGLYSTRYSGSFKYN